MEPNHSPRLLNSHGGSRLEGTYGGWICSGALELIGDRVASIIWLDAFKPETGQKPLDLTLEAFRKIFQTSVEKGEAGFSPPPKIPPIFISGNDQAFVESKLTPHPIGTYLQPITLTGARDNVAKKHTFASRGSRSRLLTRRWQSVRPTNHGPPWS